MKMCISYSTPSKNAKSSRYIFFFNHTATTEIYTLSLHDALPISSPHRRSQSAAGGTRHVREPRCRQLGRPRTDRKSTRLNSSHVEISYAVFCLKKKKGNQRNNQYDRQWF